MIFKISNISFTRNQLNICQLLHWYRNHRVHKPEKCLGYIGFSIWKKSLQSEVWFILYSQLTRHLSTRSWNDILFACCFFAWFCIVNTHTMYAGNLVFILNRFQRIIENEIWKVQRVMKQVKVWCLLYWLVPFYHFFWISSQFEQLSRNFDSVLTNINLVGR